MCLPPGGPEEYAYIFNHEFGLFAGAAWLRVIPGHRLRMVWKCSAQIRIASDSAGAIVVHPVAGQISRGLDAAGTTSPPSVSPDTFGGLKNNDHRRHTMIHTNRTAQRTCAMQSGCCGVLVNRRHPKPGPIGQRNLDRLGKGRIRRKYFRSIPHTEGDKYRQPLYNDSERRGPVYLPRTPPGTYTLAITSQGLSLTHKSASR